MKLQTILIVLILSSCANDKYKMYDIATENEFYVTEEIESGEYKPLYCENRLDKIVKVVPPILNSSLANQLNVELNKWATKEEIFLRSKGTNINYIHTDPNIVGNTTYLYTYIFDKKRTHVFTTCVHNELKNNYVNLYIRMVDNNIFGEYYEDNWVSNSCDIEITDCP